MVLWGYNSYMINNLLKIYLNSKINIVNAIDILFGTNLMVKSKKNRDIMSRFLSEKFLYVKSML